MNDKQIRWVVSIAWPHGHRTFPDPGNPSSAWGLIRLSHETSDELSLEDAMAFAEKLGLWVLAKYGNAAKVEVHPTVTVEDDGGRWIVRVGRDWAPYEFWSGHPGESFSLYEEDACIVPKEAAELIAKAIRLKASDAVVDVIQAPTSTQAA